MFSCVSNLWGKHTAESHCGTETDTKTHGYDLVIRAKVNRYKGQPDDTGGVHGEGNILGLVEISWNVASLLRNIVIFKTVLAEKDTK